MSMRFKAFTLAEVLITLGIIGVVSAMTVPSLMNNYQRQTYVTQLHKVYNEISQAFLQYKTDKNAIDLKEAGLGNITNVTTFMNQYFKVVTKCDTPAAPCFAASYQNMNGTPSENIASWWPDVPCATLASGAAVCIESLGYYEHSITSNGVTYPWAHILVDINGQKGPNIGGRDIFFFAYFADGTIDEEVVAPNNADKTAARNTDYAAKCKSSLRFNGCFGKILNDNWQMTY